MNFPDITPADWNRARELFADLLECDTVRRASLLSGQEEAIRLEAERLLAEHERDGGVLDRTLFPGLAERDLWVGQVLKDRYRIERFLARGGGGAVYLAHDQQLAGRPVVVKFLHAWARQYVWLKSRLRQEMEALARIDHRGVVGALDTGETSDGLPFLVIEYVNGVTLRSEIAKGPLEIARVSALVRGVGRAVAAAHEQGVLHRDLKPENIMLERPGTPEETVRLIDFGIARVDDLERETATGTTQFAGTTPYMAPEQLAGKPSRASDIYAIGVIAYEMVTGIRPFTTASPIQLYEQQKAGVKSELRHRAGAPERAMKTILKQLSFRPEDRSPSALEASEQIATALVGPMREPWSRRLAATVILGAAAGVAGIGYASRRMLEPPLQPGERVIELRTGTEPLEHGFIRSLSIDYHSLMNPEGTGFDAMRVFSPDQGAYYHPLNSAQSRAAHLNGWRLIMEAAVEEGIINGTLDNPADQCRYSVGLAHNARGFDSVYCLQLAAPSRKGLEVPLPGPAGARHQVIVASTPVPGKAEVWVDGVKRISDYGGAPDFRYSRGLEISTARFQSQRCSGIFWKVRLEIA